MATDSYNQLIRVKRVYDNPLPDDGFRILVDRLWPRGLRRDKASIGLWMRDVAPSTSLRKWFGHDPEKWEGFKQRYFKELETKRYLVEKILEKERTYGSVTLLFSAKNVEHNNAVALKEYVERFQRSSFS
ncbi:MAG: DUF488 family protein [Candidatus Caldarchaeum sp.]